MGVPWWLKAAASATPVGVATNTLGARTAISDYFSTDPFKQKKSPVTDMLKNKKSSKPRSQSSARKTMPRKIKRSGAFAYGRTKMKRKRAPVKRMNYKKKKRKTVKKKSKIVALTPGTARERIVDHFTKSVNVAASEESLYTGFSNIGSMQNMTRMVAQGLLLHYMHRVNDYRVSKTMVPWSGDISQVAPYNHAGTWSEIRIVYMANNEWNFGTTGATLAPDFPQFTYLSDDSAGNPRSLDQLTDLVSNDMHLRFRAGFRLKSVTIARGTGADSVILYDPNVGRNVVEFACKSRFKLQNVTVGAGTAEENNMYSIRRNPLNGMKYTFRNKVPLFKHTFLAGLGATDRAFYDEMQGQGSVDVTGMDIPTIGQRIDFKVPPKVPSVIFKNVAGKANVAIQPGLHKTFTDYEFYRGAINSFADRYYQLDQTPGAPTVPGGSCTLIGLKPFYRNSDTTDIKVECEIDYLYCCRMSKAKLTPLPVKNIVS